MMLINSFIAPSTIEGVGIFTSEPLAKGTLIWRFDPDFDRLIASESLASAPSHMAEFLRRYAYPLHDQPDMLVLEVDNGRFMNHSETPNTDFTKVTMGYTLCDIPAGAELTCNYAEFDPGFEILPTMQTLRASNPGAFTNGRMHP